MSLIFLKVVVITMMASPIQNNTKKPLKSLYSLLGSKWETRAAYSTVGNILCFCCARTCLRAEEMEWADGGASAGRGVERPLQRLSQARLKQKGVAYLDMADNGPSWFPLGFKLPSSDCARRTMGLPGLTGRGRSMCSVPSFW